MILVSGVLLVCAHSGHNLVPMDKHGLSNPSCVIYENSRQVKIGENRLFKNEKELSRVNLRKDFWNCYYEQGKKLADS